MCKFYAYGFPCKWMKRNNECRGQHDKDVRKAFQTFQEKEKIGEEMTMEDLRKALDPEKKLKEMDFKVKKYLYMKYPRPLTKKERAEIQDEQEKDELESYFMNEFGVTNPGKEE